MYFIFGFFSVQRVVVEMESAFVNPNLKEPLVNFAKTRKSLVRAATKVSLVVKETLLQWLHTILPLFVY